MPSTNKRINLTISEPLYEKISAYRDENGIVSDAGACIQLISAQLKGLESTKQLMQVMRKFSAEELEHMSREGLNAINQLDIFPTK
jgi:hypothetical protein